MFVFLCFHIILTHMKELSSIEKIVQAEILKRSLYETVKYFWDVIIADEFKDNWHIEYVCNEVQYVYERVFKRLPKEYDLLINIPPNTSKSTMVSVMAPVWGWINDPSIRYITGSNTSTLAIDHATKSRDIIKSHKFKELFADVFDLKADRDLKTNYENDKNGSRAVCSVGSSIIGKHAHIINIDDPIDPKGARSETEITSATNWVNNDLRTRKIDQSITPTILIMQRLSEDDPSGNWIEYKKGLKHICIPAQLTSLDNCKPVEIKSKYVNDLLDPIRLPLHELDSLKSGMGSSAYAGQYLQSPKAFDGNIVKREWFRFYDHYEEKDIELIIHSWDTAFKAKENNDYSCCTIWAVMKNGYYLIDVYKEKIESPDLKRKMIELAERDNPDYILIEDKASGIVMIQQLQDETKLNIIPVQVHNDKTVRLRDASPTIESGNIYFPRRRDFSLPTIDNMCIFPNGKHDDDVDSITQFINWIKVNFNSKNTKPITKKRESNKILKGY